MTELDRVAQHWGFLAIRELPGDESIAGVQPLMTTTSLVLGVTWWEYRYRFCFNDPALAFAALAAVQTEDDIPEGWIACRPQVTVCDPGGLPRYPTPDELRALRVRARRGG